MRRYRCAALRCSGAALALLALVGIAPVHAIDSENVTLVNQWSWSTWHADLWGYAADEVELIIVGAYESTKFFDVTDPQNPVEVLDVPGPDSIWRDIKTYGTHAYIVNDDLGLGGPGIQIVDLSDPTSPVLVNEVGNVFDTAHNVWIDVDLGLLFAVGADNGTEIFDLTGDPVNPQHIYTQSEFYTHDMYSRNGVAYMSAIYDGDLVALDLTQLPTSVPELGRIQTDGAFTHNVWLTDDGQHALTGDEVSGGPMTIINVSDPTNMYRVASWFPPEDPTAVMHNVIVEDDIAYIGWYKAGLQVVDVSDPANPQRVAFYDSFEGSGDGYDGSWGAYPFLPSGYVHMSDITSGLNILDVQTGVVSVLGADGRGPGALRLQAVGPNPVFSDAAIRFELQDSRKVVLDVFDAGGRQVRRLIDQSLPSGSHRVVWDGRDSRGIETAPGVYIVSVRSGGEAQSRKVVRAR